MKLVKQEDGSFTLINVKENPSGLSTSQDLETKVAVLTEAEAVQMFSDFGGSDDLAKAIQALKDDIAAQSAVVVDLQSKLSEQTDLLATQSSEIASLTTERDGLSARVAELTVQAQDAETENVKLKASLEDLSKPVDPEPADEEPPAKRKHR